MSENVCLVSCLLPFEGPMRQCWTDFARELDSVGSKLVMLSSHDSTGLPFPVIQLPFFFRDYLDWFPLACTSAPLSPEDKAYAEYDRQWIAPSYPLTKATAGLSACRAVARTILQSVKPGHVLLWDAASPSIAIFQQLCWQTGIPVHAIERGFLPGTLMIDSRLHRAYSDLRTHWLAQDIKTEPQTAETFERARGYYLLNRPQKYRQPSFGGGGAELRKRLGLPPTHKVILFLGEQEQGAVQPYASAITSTYNSPIFSSNEETVEALIGVVLQMREVTLIIKPHPSDKNTYDKAQANGARFISDANVHALIDLADVVVVQSTTLQFETAFYDKPCVLLARSAWWGMNATYELHSPDRLLQTVRDALNREDWGTKQANARTFIAWMLNNYLIGSQGGVPSNRGLSDLARYVQRISAVTTDLEPANQRVATAMKVLRSFAPVVEQPSPLPLSASHYKSQPTPDGTKEVPSTILFVSHEASRTGAPIFLLHFLRWLRSHTTIHFRVLLGRPGPLEPEFRALADTARVDQIDSVPSQFWSNVVLVYSNTCTNGEVVSSLPCAGVPVLTHVHELDAIIEMFGQSNFTAVRRQSYRFVACSQAVAETLTSRKHIPVGQVSLHYEMISVSEVTQRAAAEPEPIIRARLGIPGDGIVVAGCGTADWRKGPDLFLQVAAALLREYAGRKELYFIWIGLLPDDDRGRTLRHDCARLKLGARMQFVGEQENSLSFLNACDVFLLPSREDPFPLVMLEAAALGKPLVCFEGSGGAMEFAAQGGGFAAPYLDTVAMAHECSRLIDDQSLRKSVGDTAGALVRASFDTEVAAPRLLAEIETILRETQSTAALRREGDRFVAIGNLRAAAGCLAQIVQLAPNDIESALGLGHLLYQQGDLDGAAQQFEATSKRFPDRPEPEAQLAMVLVQLDRLAEAEKSALHALSLEPDNVDMLHLAGMLALHENRPSDALNHYTRLVKLNPNDLEAHVGQAQCRIGMGHLVLAEILLAKVLKQQPDHQQARSVQTELISRQAAAKQKNT